MSVEVQEEHRLGEDALKEKLLFFPPPLAATLSSRVEEGPVSYRDEYPFPPFYKTQAGR